MRDSRTMKERLSVIETEVKNTNLRISEMDDRVKANIDEIKKLISEHVDWQKKEHALLEGKFANKWVEKVAVGSLLSVVGTLVAILLGKL